MRGWRLYNFTASFLLSPAALLVLHMYFLFVVCDAYTLAENGIAAAVTLTWIDDDGAAPRVISP